MHTITISQISIHYILQTIQEVTPKVLIKVAGYINQQMLGRYCGEAHREGQGDVNGICGFREGI